MKKAILSLLAAAMLSGFVPVLAIVTPSEAASFCSAATSETDCPAMHGCGWKAAETWTRTEDGKVRNIRAGCKFDAKAARNFLADEAMNMHGKPATKSN